MGGLRVPHPGRRLRRGLARGAAALLLASFAAAPAFPSDGVPDFEALRAAAREVLAQEPWRRATAVEEPGKPPRLSYDLAWDLDESPVAPTDALSVLRSAQVEIEAVRALAAREDEAAGRFGTGFWEEAILAAEGHVRSGIAALAEGRQPPPAMQDRATLARWRARDALLSRLWAWAHGEGRRLVAPRTESIEAAEGPEVEDYAELKAEVLRALVYVRRPSRGIVLAEGAVEYYLEADPPPLGTPGERPISPLRRATDLAARIRTSAVPPGVAGEGPGAWSWAPAFARAEAILTVAVAEATDDRHALAARSQRAAVRGALVQGVFLSALWERALELDLLLWPLAGPPGEGRDLGTPVGADPPSDGTAFSLFVEPARRILHVSPARYETRTEQYEVSPGRWEERDGQRVWVPPVYGTRQVTVALAPADTREELRPARALDLSISAEFGEVRHVWFLDRFTYETRRKYRPDPPNCWDRGADLPPAPPWVDLWVSRDALVRRREPLQEGYVVVVGTKGARGPELVQFGSEAEARAVFSTCTRPFP